MRACLPVCVWLRVLVCWLGGWAGCCAAEHLVRGRQRQRQRQLWAAHPQPTHPPRSPRPALPRLLPWHRFHVCCQRAVAEWEGREGPDSEHDDSDEIAKGMARLFAEVGEAYTELIAQGAPRCAALQCRRDTGPLLLLRAVPDAPRPAPGPRWPLRAGRQAHAQRRWPPQASGLPESKTKMRTPRSLRRHSRGHAARGGPAGRGLLPRRGRCRHVLQLLAPPRARAHQRAAPGAHRSACLPPSCPPSWLPGGGLPCLHYARLPACARIRHKTIKRP
jgi:hypothetical protein